MLPLIPDRGCPIFKKGGTYGIFADEAQKAGHHVSVFQIGNRDIRGCKNCDACRATLNGNCVQEDDMQEIYPIMRECEMLVIASPIYYYFCIGTFCVW
ncbi:MAG: NAD(P)H-dependent oxidoreductase [Lachnospiraceae bacterium]|nr:NAD(P)H-dependent oxidoreductase [Lachnospiraceae bacterium]